MKVFFTLFTVIFFTCCFQNLNAQNIQISMSPHPSPYLSDWESHSETLILIVNNTSGNSVDVKISTQLYNGNGDIIAQTDGSKMPVLSIPSGISSYHAEDIYPEMDIKYDNSYKDRVVKTGRLPDDNYRLCVSLTDPKTGVPLTSQQPQCKTFTITAYQAPILMSPRDKDTVNTKQLQGFIFKWTPLVPRPAGLVTYHLQIWEILPGQDAMRAFLGNKPIVEKDILNMTQAAWPPDFELPREGMGYVWSIQALDAEGRAFVGNGGRAEPFSFWVKNESNLKQTTNIIIELQSPLGKQKANDRRPDFKWKSIGDDVVTYNLTFTRNWVAGDTDSNIANQRGNLKKGGEVIPFDTLAEMSKNPGSLSRKTAGALRKGGNVIPFDTLNSIIISKTGINGTVFHFPPKIRSLERGAKYSWFVSAFNSKGDTVGKSKNADFTESSVSMTSPFCTDFENGTTGGWQPNNILTDLKPSGGNPGKYVETTDESGASFFYNTDTSYTGNWNGLISGGCGSLCFDVEYNYIGDTLGWRGWSTNPPAYSLTPSISICGGGDTASFVVSSAISVGDGWHTFCAPLKGLNTDGTMPSNSDGHWIMRGTEPPSNWTTLLSNVSRVWLPCDPSSYQSERLGYDNICVKNTGDCTPHTSGGPCDSLHANAVKNPNGNCCWKINLSHPNNTTGIKGIQFLALSPNTFASHSLSSSSGWMTSVANTNEFKIKHLSGYVTPGQLNGFLNFCMNTLSSQSKIVVNWLSDTNTIICSDTVTVYCAIPCAAITKDTVTCNGINYNIKYAFTNNANFSVSNIRYTVLSPAGAAVAPLVTNLSSPLANGQNSGDISLALTGVSQNTIVCILMRFRSADSCCWCYDTLCITTPPCICNNIAASVSGNIYNCCYNLSLTNNYAANYFTEVKLTCISSGVTFSTFTFSGNWGAMGVFPSNVAEVANGSGYIPFGVSSNVGSLCFTGYTTTPQFILVQWIRNDTIVCTDTIQTNCVPPSPPHNNCSQIVHDTLICLSNGTYQYTFQIQNNDPTNTTTGFQLNPVLPGGLVMTPFVFNVSIPPNTVSAPQTLIISGIGQLTHFCFEIALFQHVGNLYSWCCHGDTVCLTTPSCGSCCPGTWGSIYYSTQNAAGFSHTALSCGKEYPITCSIPYPITASYTCNSNDPTCSGSVTYKVLPNTGATITTAGVFTATSSGTYTVVIYGWCGTHKCDSCIVSFVVSCTSGCCPGTWGSIYYATQNAAGFSHTALSCGKEYPINCSQPYPITAIYTCNSNDPTCSGNVTYKVLPNTGASITSAGVFTATISGNYSLVIYGWCGTHLCDSCTIYFVVTCAPSCCPGNWGDIYYTIQYPGTSMNTPLSCGKSYPATCSQAYPITANYICSLNNPSCAGSVTYKVLPNTGATITSAGVFTATLSGTYSVVIYGWCGTHICDSCVIKFVVTCPPACCPGKWSNHYFTTQNAAGTVKTDIKCDGNYAIACGQGYSITAVYGCPTPFNGSCDQKVTYSVSPATGATITSGGLFTATASGTYIVTMNGWCGGSICESCSFKFQVTCKDCCPGKWGLMSYSYSIIKQKVPKEKEKILPMNNVTTVPMACKKTYTLNCNQVYTISTSYYCNDDPQCAGYVTYKVSPAGATITAAGVFTATATGSYIITIYGHCGGGICDSCQVNFRVTCPNTNPCVITSWSAEPITYSNARTKGSIKPGSKVTLVVGKTYTFESPAYLYAEASPCLPSYSWAMDGTRMQDGKTTTLSFTKGSHTVTITPGCNGDNCKPIQFIVNAK